MNLAELVGIRKKGIKTLKMQMAELMLSKAFQAIKESYIESEEEQQLIGICFKLLLRSKRMFDARQDVVKILRLVYKREALILKFESMDSGEVVSCYNLLLDISVKIFNSISLLQDEHKILRRPFVFKQVDYLD